MFSDSGLKWVIKWAKALKRYCKEFPSVQTLWPGSVQAHEYTGSLILTQLSLWMGGGGIVVATASQMSGIWVLVAYL